MQILLKKLFEIREGEGLRAFLMFSYIFLIIASLLIVKPVRNSLFLTTFGVAKLPNAFIMVAIFSGIFIYVYSKFSQKIYFPVLILSTIVISMSLFGIFWFLLFFDYKGNWFLYVFYVWVAIFGVVLTMQFWLLANYVFNAREAKRLFGFVGAGAISGGIFGGYLTNYLAPIIGTENLLIICIGFLGTCFFLFRIIWTKSARLNYKEKIQQQRRIQPTGIVQSSWRLIWNSKHLTYLAGIVGIGSIVANLVDYQYSAVASDIITNQDKLTAFFGFWLSNLSIISLMAQLFLTRRVLQTFGVGTSLFFLPVGILVGAIAILISPLLWAAVLIKVGDGSLKQSINKAAIELLYLPVPITIKNQAKAFIDVFVDNLATGVGGLLLLALTLGLGFTVGHISVMIIGLIVIWSILVNKIRREYINSFRVAIEKRTINIDEEVVNVKDAAILKNIIGILDSKNERQILYALSLLEGLKKDEFLPYFEKLLDHHSTEIKVRVLRILQEYNVKNLNSKIGHLVEDASQRVHIAAMQYLLSHSEDKTKTLNEFLNHPDYRIHGSAITIAAKEILQDKDLKKQINLKELFDNRLKEYLSVGNDAKSQFMKLNAAEVIGISNDVELYPYLKILLDDPSPEVLPSAIMNAGRTHSKEFVPTLIDHLDTKLARKYAREALSEYGESIIDGLVGRMNDPGVANSIRWGVPKVLAMVGSQKSANALMENLRQNDLSLRYQILKALNKLKVEFPLLKFDERLIEVEILEETKNYYEILIILYKQNDLEKHVAADKVGSGKLHKIGEARALLKRALEERLDDNLERIFRLLGLKYRQKDMFNAYQGIKSNKPDLRANAVEFLDNVLESNLKKFIIPIVESRSYDYLLEKSRQFFGFTPLPETDCLTMLLGGDDAWLKSCALFLLGELKHVDCISLVEKLVESKNQMVREVAQYALNNFRK